jgi:hypothetical protein
MLNQTGWISFPAKFTPNNSSLSSSLRTDAVTVMPSLLCVWARLLNGTSSIGFGEKLAHPRTAVKKIITMARIIMISLPTAYLAKLRVRTLII